MYGFFASLRMTAHRKRETVTSAVSRQKLSSCARPNGSETRPYTSKLPAYAALPGALASRVFSLPTLTLICLGLASAFFARLIFRIPLS